MSKFFLTVVNMSISASWVVFAVLLLRLLLKKAPKWITVLLWGIVAIRLICPFTIESVISLIPSAETISPEIMMDRTPEIHTGIPFLNSTVNPLISESFAPDPATSANPLQLWIPTLACIWVIGIVGMLIYTVISYCRVKSKIGTAILLQDNIFQSENIISPFVLGIIKPRIYLPFHISEQDMQHVIAHEQAHIRRKDHLWKPLGFLILTVHWFNPLMWLGYVLLCRDIELACDEKVIKVLDTEQKADYSQALLTCSVSRRAITACPLAFGEVGVTKRIRSVLHYKKPAIWVIVVAILASIVVAVCFLTSPKASPDTKTPDDGSADGSETIITTVDIVQLRARFPMYFDLPTSNGLEVYIWQMADGFYSCGLLPGRDLDYTFEELFPLYTAPASIEEMRVIVASYGIDQSEVTICPLRAYHSSYYYKIDDAYSNNIEETFWNGYSGNLTVIRPQRATISGSFTATVRAITPNYVLDDTTPSTAVVTCYQQTPFTVSLGEALASQVQVGETYVFEIESKRVNLMNDPTDTAQTISPEKAIPLYNLQISTVRPAKEDELGLNSSELILTQ